jgi:uncharacterized protein YdaU (DUF1376 family)
MSADHWMRFNIGDYLADTMNLSTMQHGIYILLIMHYFKRGELPSNDSGLARIAKVPTRQWKLHSPGVMALFRKSENGLWRHKRIDQERAKLQRKQGETHARVSPSSGDDAPPERARQNQKPELKLVRTRGARPPARGGFSHNLAERRAAGGGG